MEKNWAKEILDAFTDLRIRRGWTYRQAAERLGVSAGYLAAVENQAKHPSESLLEAMVKFLVGEQKENRMSLKIKELSKER